MAPSTRDVGVRPLGRRNARVWHSLISFYSEDEKLLRTSLFFRREVFVHKCSFVAKLRVMRILLKLVFLANFNVICAYHEMFPFV